MKTPLDHDRKRELVECQYGRDNVHIGEDPDDTGDTHPGHKVQHPPAR
jgi:hypothetical protein